MKKSAAAVLTAMLVTSGMASITTSASAETTVTSKALKEWQSSTEIALDKKWTISFNQGISKDVDLTKYVSVVDEQGSVISTKVSLSEDQKKIIVAPVKKYHAAARYTLTIKEGLPSIKGKALKDTIQKHFETVNPVTYGTYDKSYLIENTNSGPTTVTLNQPADYIVYDKAKQMKRQYMNATDVKLDEGQLAVISYKEKAMASAPTITSGSASVTDTEQAAFTIVQLEKDGTIELSNLNAKNSIDVYLADDQQGATYEYASYRHSNNSAISMDIATVNSDFSSMMIHPSTDSVFTNTSKQTLTIYVPNKSTSIKQVNEDALSRYALAPQKNAVIFSIVDSLANENMPYKLTDHLNKGTYNYADYSEKNTSLSFDEAVLKEEYTSKDVNNSGESIIENTGESTIEIVAPARVVNVKETEEKALTYYMLDEGKSMSVTTTEKQPAFNTVYKSKGTLGQGYNEVSFNAVGNLITQNERKFDDTKYYNENAISIDFENIVENTSTAPLEFYGPARFLNFKNSNEKALTYYTLQPGEQATVRTTEPKGTEFSSDYVVQDKTKTGKFTTEQFTKDNESTSKTSIEFNYYGDTSSLLAFGDGYQIIKNTGDIELTLIGASRYITFEK